MHQGIEHTASRITYLAQLIAQIPEPDLQDQERQGHVSDLLNDARRSLFVALDEVIPADRDVIAELFVFLIERKKA